MSSNRSNSVINAKKQKVKNESSSSIQEKGNTNSSNGRIKLVTKLLVDSKYGLMDDLNYGRAFSPTQGEALRSHTQESNANGILGERTPILKVPKSTRLKAERVRIYMDYYYNILERSILLDSTQQQSTHTQQHHHKHHEGVEGIYNPLQVIRNRKLRKKYHDVPPVRELSLSRPPIIAITQFSNKRNKRMMWFVDLTERYNDLTWRTSHWDELVKPDGTLWFPPSSPNKKRNKIIRRKHKSSRQKVEQEDASMSVAGYEDIPLKQSGSPHHDVEVVESPKGQTTVLYDNHLEVKGKHGGTNSSSDDQIVSSGGEGERGRKNKLEKIIIKTNPKRWSKSPNKLDLKFGLESTSSKSKSRGSFSNTSNVSEGGNTGVNYMTPIEPVDVQKTSLLNSIPVNRLKKKVSSSSASVSTAGSFDSDGSSSTDDDESQINDDDGIIVTAGRKKRRNRREKEAVPQEEVNSSAEGSVDLYQIPVDEQLQQYWQETRYIRSTIAIMKHRRKTHELIKRRAIRKRNKMVIHEDADDIIKETSEVIEEYNNELNRAIKIGNTWTSKLLNDYSIRVETLISASDRILSDISTTLTLKLKLFQENSERFGNLKMMKSQKMTKIVYRVLEFTIVSLLWTIWLFVSMLREIRLGFIFFLKLVKWAIW